MATLREGREPLSLQVRGTTYADGRLRHHGRTTTLVVEPGQEVPLVVPLSR